MFQWVRCGLANRSKLGLLLAVLLVGCGSGGGGGSDSTNQSESTAVSAQPLTAVSAGAAGSASGASAEATDNSDATRGAVVTGSGATPPAGSSTASVVALPVGSASTTIESPPIAAPVPPATVAAVSTPAPAPVSAPVPAPVSAPVPAPVLAPVASSAVAAQPAVTTNAAPEFLSVERISGGPRVLRERVTYRSNGLLINGLVCRPNEAGRYPILMYQHAGFSGLRSDWDGNGLCQYMADRGYAVFMSSYRGEDNSEGIIEFCAGEVDDSLRLLEIARTQPYAKSDLVALLGISHGGCISWQMIVRGLVPQVIVDVVGPKEWTGLYNYVAAQAAAGGLDPDMAQFFLMADANVGSPQTVPAAYAARSPTHFAGVLANYPGAALVVHGARDDVVPPVQSCDFVRLMGGFTFSHLNRRYIPRIYERTTTAHPPTCGAIELPWIDAYHPGRNDWQGERHFVIYDEMSHSSGLQLPYALDDAENFIRTRLPGGRRE